MNTKLFLIIPLALIGMIGMPELFADDLFNGEATFQRVPESIIPGIPSEFEIKFLYTGAPYTLQNLTAIIETNPKTASQYVHFNLNSTEMSPSTVGRIPVTITIDESIPNKKIFLSVTYVGTDLHGNFFKSAWADTLTLDISSKNITSKLPSSQDNSFEKLTGATCDGKATLCYGTFLNGTTIPVQCDYFIHGCGAIPSDYVVSSLSPLKQFKTEIPFDDIECKENLILVQKYDGSPACVKSETAPKLMQRGWILPELKPESELTPITESETKFWKSTDDWNSMRLVRNGDGLYCNSSNEKLSDQCYPIDEIVFGNDNKMKETGWRLYPGGAGWILPENSTLSPIYKNVDFGVPPLDFTAMLDDKIFVNKCESNGGVWNYTYHDCQGIEEICHDIDGIDVSMGVSIPCTGLCLDRGVYRVACVFEYEN